MMNGECRAWTKIGEPCKALASKNGLCALHAEPSRASDLGRRSGKARRYAGNKSETELPFSVPETALDVRKALGRVMADLVARRLDPRTASSVAYVGNIMLRAIEVGDLEERLSRLEGLKSATEESEDQ